ncbi:MAG: hypothetical protein N2111_14085, partial [Candidatus Sumerlaeaceae bacterium]|nr:hypothetical protein [Candidatus Sumerlaeaceae bacterium]
MSLIALVIPLRAQDAIVFKTGKRVEGKIVEERDGKIFIEHPLTGVTGFDLKGIERIERGAASASATGASGTPAGRPEDVIRGTLDAIAVNPAAADSASANFSSAVYQLLQSAQGHRATGNLERAGAEYRTLLQALSNPASVQLLRGEEFHSKITQTVADELADVDYRLGAAAAQQPSQMRQAQAYLTEAVRLAPQNLSYRFELARVAQANGDVRTALAAYEAVAAAPAAPPELKARAETAVTA